MRARDLFVTTTLVVLLSACGTPEPGTSPVQGQPTNTTEEPGMPDPTGPFMTPSPADHDALAQSARQDLAARLDVDPDEIEVGTVHDVIWPDGSIGCPEPDKMYTQALVEGAYIELVHAGDTYPYHWGHGLPEPFLCEGSDGPPGGARS